MLSPSFSSALGNTTSVSYDKVGNIVRVLNAKNQITAYTYDALGNVLTMVDPQGGTYTFTYDDKGQLLSTTNPEGETVTQEWNEKGKLQSQTNGEGERTTYDYDAKGNLTAVFQPNGNVLNYFYDQVDRISQVSDNIGTIAKYTYDGNGNRLTVTDGLDRTMTYTYDALNRRISEALPSGSTTTYAYDSNSNLLTVTDAKGNATTYTDNALNQQTSHTDALGAKTQFEYDDNGNLTKAIDAKNNATTYTYDALNHNTDIAFANGATLQYGYDELGRVVTSKDRANNQFKYAYDALGNLLNKLYPDGSADKYSYDGISRMLSAVNNAATVEFTYDKAGRLLSEMLNGKVTGYSYDVAVGKRTLTYPSGMKVEEHLNARDLITSILQNGDEVVTMAYNVAGQKTTQGYANGITTTYGYNENGWLSSITADHDILSLEMDYDDIGNITQRRDLLNADRTESYGYDVISQLTSFRRGATVDNSYQFDLLGNRVKVLENGVATNYTSNNVNAYTSITGPQAFTPTYDENGNLLQDAANKYSYDYNNRLASAGTTTYKYDALGRRIAKGNTTYYYLGDQIVEEYNGTSNLKSYLIGNYIDEVLQVQKGNALYYYVTNHIGSIMAITNTQGAIIEQIEYNTYGTPSFFDANGNEQYSSLIDNSMLFAGREYDLDIKSYYYRARYINPSLGRFIQKDPLHYTGGLNDYEMLTNNPILLVDIYGERPTTKEASEMAKHVYGKGGVELSGGWKPSDLKIDGVRYRNDTWFTPSKGFNSGLYEREINGKKEYAYVTQGTDPESIMDWLNNVQQGIGLGFLPGQYSLSMKNAKKLSKALADCELTFIGHSLGGGMASANALKTGREGITFNAAGLHPATTNPWYKITPDILKPWLKYRQRNKGESLIEANVINGELMDTFNSLYFPTGRAMGKINDHYVGNGNILDKHDMMQFINYFSK